MYGYNIGKMKKYSITIFLLINLALNAQKFHTQIFHSNIKTLQIQILTSKFSLPIIELNGTDILQFSFDEMSHGAHSYSYKILHCNADWTESGLNSQEYLGGFTSAAITDLAQSVNTTYLYTHYQFQLPNNDFSFKISGNYVVQIYEDNRPENPIAQACFSVVEPHVSVSGSVRGNTDIELNERLQQLDFEILLNGYVVRDVNSELKVLVRQNNRTDNQLENLQPTYFTGSKLNYINQKELIFEGGYEYHRFDISSIYAAGEGVANVQYDAPYYNVYLNDDKIKKTHIYSSEMDVNGKFVIHLQNATLDENVSADYMLVHFSLPTKNPFFDGQLFLGTEFNYNLLNDAVKLNYDGKTESYKQTVLLKQGGYNYQYWFLQKGLQKANVERVDGSFWQTSNEYSIYVYHRAWGERYDKLIGTKIIQ